jgi:hypothetical protein
VSGVDTSRAAQDALRDELVAAAWRQHGASRAAQDAVRDQLIVAWRRQRASRTGQDAVRDQLVAAGEGRPSPAARQRRRRRRTTGLIVVALLGAAAAAEATGLISVGDPLPNTIADRRPDDPRFAAARPGSPELVATAPDPEYPLAWGVGIYTARDRRDCVIAGQVRGRSLGLERAGSFRPYDDVSTGACADVDRRPLLLDRLAVGGPRPRTIVFGRTATPDRPVVLSVRGERHTAQPGRGGGFLIVVTGALSASEVRVVDAGDP